MEPVQKKLCVLQVLKMEKWGKMILSEVQGAAHRSAGFDVCPSGLWFCLVWMFLPIAWFFPFEMGVFTLCQYLLDICNLLLILWERIVLRHSTDYENV